LWEVSCSGRVWGADWYNDPTTIVVVGCPDCTSIRKESVRCVAVPVTQTGHPECYQEEGSTGWEEEITGTETTPTTATILILVKIDHNGEKNSESSLIVQYTQSWNGPGLSRPSYETILTSSIRIMHFQRVSSRTFQHNERPDDGGGSDVVGEMRVETVQIAFLQLLRGHLENVVG
jgi:hypothetical protein